MLAAYHPLFDLEKQMFRPGKSEKRVWKVMGAMVALGCLSMPALAQNENSWCDRNCVSLCQAVAGKGYVGTVQQCIAQYTCPAYAGRACAPASVVQNRANAVNNRQR